MMIKNKEYNPKESEKKWYNYWLENKYFESNPDSRAPFTITIPPPNVTGILHMGHVLNSTIQDVLIRRARMKGFNACWIPGTDHASIATEAKVVANLKKRGIDKSDLTREEFLSEVKSWTESNKGVIVDQLKRLGVSLDWGKIKFTMDKQMYESVIEAFVKLYNKGYIYRGNRMVNWDPEAKTTISNEEVIYKQVNSKLYYLKYKIVGSQDYAVIATTRPETIFGDTAVCINPKNRKTTFLKNKKVVIPIVNKEIPVIEDQYVDPKFGTGCLKVTPAHDVNDYALGLRHELELIQIFNNNATLNENGMHYNGLDRFEVRKKIVIELQEKNLLEKIEPYIANIGTSERTGAIIEPMISLQWFLSMKELVKPAIEAVESKKIQLIPQNYIKTYMYWMKQKRDWNISRQLYWGHRIPAYYYGEGTKDYVVAKNKKEALKLAKLKSGISALTQQDLQQDSDVLDTWFSSWLWPIIVFDGIRNPKNKYISYYYPTNILVTGPDILFFWVARMIIAGYEFQKEKPFSTVYLTGIVRDKKGRKMSKSLGNSPDPMTLMNSYSTDAVRVGILLTSPAGNDLPFDEKLCLQGRNFANKIWNAKKLIKGWVIDKNSTSEIHVKAIEWFEEKTHETLNKLEELYANHKISEALMTTYKYIWDDFCSWYLEIIKPPFGESISHKTYERTIIFFENILKILHPFMPFITEEIWQSIKVRKKDEAIVISSWPSFSKNFNKEVLESFEMTKDRITALRNFKKSRGISPNILLNIKVKPSSGLLPYQKIIEKLAGIGPIEILKTKLEKGTPILIGLDEFYIELEDTETLEKEKIEKSIKYLEGFIHSVQIKLRNEKFIKNAPDIIINKEKKKEIDTKLKIEILKKQLKQLEK